MSGIVEHSVEVEAPVHEVFAYLDDFTNAKDWMYGLHSIVPVEGPTHGLGATFDGVMKLGVSLSSRIRCTGYEPDRMVEISSISGIKNAQRWTFTPIGEDRTRVDAWISYTLPGGPAGKVIERAVNPLISIAIKHTSERLVQRLEQRSST